MKHYRIFFLPALCLSVASPGVFAQGNELDITIRVMNENEQPDEFVQRLELPPPDSFGISLQNENSGSLTLDDEVSNTGDEITAAADASEQVSINTIIDNISINGAGSDDTEGNTDNLPQQVVDILDENLPLNTDLTDTLDETTGEIVDVINDLPGGDITDDVIDDLPVDLGDDVVDSVDDVSGGIVDVVEDIDSPADGIEDTVGELNDDLNSGLDSDLGNEIANDLNGAGSADELPLALDDIGNTPVDEDTLDIPESLTDGL